MATFFLISCITSRRMPTMSAIAPKADMRQPPSMSAKCQQRPLFRDDRLHCHCRRSCRLLQQGGFRLSLFLRFATQPVAECYECGFFLANWSVLEEPIRAFTRDDWEWSN